MNIPQDYRLAMRQRWRTVVAALWPHVVQLQGGPDTSGGVTLWVPGIEVSALLHDGYIGAHPTLVRRYAVPTRRGGAEVGAKRGRMRVMLAWGPTVRALRRLLLTPANREYTAAEGALLMKMARRGATLAEMAAATGRTLVGVRQYLNVRNGLGQGGGVHALRYKRPGMLTTGQFEAALRVTRTTVKHWRKRGLPCEVVREGMLDRYAFWLPEVTEWLRRDAQQTIWRRLDADVRVMLDEVYDAESRGAAGLIPWEVSRG